MVKVEHGVVEGAGTSSVEGLAVCQRVDLGWTSLAEAKAVGRRCKAPLVGMKRPLTALILRRRTVGDQPL